MHSDWTIQRSLERLVDGVSRELIVLCFEPGALAAFEGPMAAITGNRDVRVLVPQGRAGGLASHDGIHCFEAGKPLDFFEVKIFDEVFSASIRRKGTLFRLECIVIADDRESMLVYTQDGQRRAVVITLPFITCVQSRLFSRMIAHAHELPGDHGPGTLSR